MQPVLYKQHRQHSLHMHCLLHGSVPPALLQMLLLLPLLLLLGAMHSCVHRAPSTPKAVRHERSCM